MYPRCPPDVSATLCSLTSPQLMEMPSLARSPVAPVLLSLSEPAKSTKWNLALSVSYSSMSLLPLETRLSPSSCWKSQEERMWQVLPSNLNSEWLYKWKNVHLIMCLFTVCINLATCTLLWLIYSKGICILLHRCLCNFKKVFVPYWPEYKTVIFALK